MKINSQHIELFDQYLSGTLNEEWKAAFEEKLLADVLLKSEFEQHVLVISALKKTGRTMLKADLINIESGLNVTDTKRYRTRKGRMAIKILAVATIVMVGIAAYWFIARVETNESQQSLPTLPLMTDTLEKKEPVQEKTIKRSALGRNIPTTKSLDTEIEIAHRTIYIVGEDTVSLTPAEVRKMISSGKYEADTAYQIVDSVRVESEYIEIPDSITRSQWMLDKEIGKRASGRGELE